MISGNSKGVDNRQHGLATLQVQEKVVMDTVLIWRLHRKHIVKILIGHKYNVRHLNKKILNYF